MGICAYTVKGQTIKAKIGGPSATNVGETWTRTYNAPRTYLVESIQRERSLGPMAIWSSIVIAPLVPLDNAIKILSLHSPSRVSGSFGNQMAPLH